ncbi:MAG TPA: N-acyl homoserine lactonase family protein [Myxococcaceae bacterium]
MKVVRSSILAFLATIAASSHAHTATSGADAGTGVAAPVKVALPTPRLYVLDCGRIQSASAEEYGLGPNEVADTSMADPCFLVVHRRGVLLFDTGLPDRLVGHPTVLEGYGLEVNTPLRAQLEAIGFRPSDVTHLALSHSHFDHIGNAPDFAGATWIAQKAELDAVFGKDAREPPPPELQALAHARKQVIEGDHDVFGDGTVVLLFTPGHTPGHQSLYVKLAKTGGVVISGDLYHHDDERTLDRMPADERKKATPASRRKIETVLVHKHAQLWIGHSTTFFRNAVKAPSWYD